MRVKDAFSDHLARQVSRTFPLIPLRSPHSPPRAPVGSKAPPFTVDATAALSPAPRTPSCSRPTRLSRAKSTGASRRPSRETRSSPCAPAMRIPRCQTLSAARCATPTVRSYSTVLRQGNGLFSPASAPRPAVPLPATARFSSASSSASPPTESRHLS